METREIYVPIINEASNEDETYAVAAIEEAVPLVTEIFHGESILQTDPLIHNEATQETKIVIDQDSHNATSTAAEVPQVNSSIQSTTPSNAH